MRPLTRNQSLVLDALAQSGQPLSAYGILALLRERGLRAPLQVYRALEKLVEVGLVHRIESLNAFVACAHPPGERHGLVALAICDSCGSVTELPDEATERRLIRLSRNHAFAPARITLELRGVCGSCQVQVPT